MFILDTLKELSVPLQSCDLPFKCAQLFPTSLK